MTWKSNRYKTLLWAEVATTPVPLFFKNRKGGKPLHRIIKWNQAMVPKLMKILKSKAVVMLALFGVALGGFYTVNHAESSDANGISRVYQYYLLANTNGQVAKASNAGSGDDGNDPDKKEKATTKMVKGVLGNGGNQGTFSYQNIIQGAQDKDSAKRFSEIMATLSDYSFISVQSNGVDKILDLSVRWIAGFILMLAGLLEDMFDIIRKGIINFIAEYNPYTLLGGLWGQTATAQNIAAAFGITTDELKEWASAFLVIFTGVMIWSIMAALQRGRQLDSAKAHKLMGRLVGFTTMPLVIIGACTLLADASRIANPNPTKDTPAFASWIMDVDTWATKDRFDTGVAFSGIGVKANAGAGKYVDSRFNPYGGKIGDKKTGKNYAAIVGQNLYAEAHGDDKTLFPNTTLALNYMRSQTIDPKDYLSYVMTHDWEEKGYKAAFADNNYAKLYDFNKKYDAASGKQQTGDDYMSGGNPMSKAADDYGTAKKPNQSPAQTWVDRYIFGAKHSGSLSTYYKEQPSGEQIYSNAGSGDGDKLSIESTYYVLNTKFDNLGGTFSLDGPTYGAYSTISKFDSNRYYYYKYSMIGTPMFTIPAMLSEALIKGLITFAMIVVMFSIGIADMFVKPFRAWVKSSTFGDLEYTYAQLSYVMGLLGTIVSLDLMPSIINDIIKFAVSEVASAATDGLPTSNKAAVVSAAPSMMAGLGAVVSCSFAIVAWLAYWKNWGGLRDKVTEIMTIPWDWASRKGQQLEDMVSSSSGAMGNAKERHQQQRDKREGFLKGIAGNQTGLGRGLNRVTGGLAGKAATGALSAANKLGAYGNIDDRDNPVDGGKSQRELNADEIRRLGANGRIGKALREFSNVSTPSAKEIANDFAKNAGDNLSEEALMNHDGTFDENNDYIDSETADAMEQYNQATYGNLDEDERQRMNELHDKMATDGLSSAEADELKELENKAANGNNRLAATQAMDKAEIEGAKNIKGLDGSKQKDFDNKNQQLEAALGKKDFAKYQKLVDKQGKGERLSGEEKQQFTALTDKATDESNANAMDINALMDRNEMQRKNARAFDSRELADMQRLQGLRRAEMSRAPLSQDEQLKYGELKGKRDEAVQQQLGLGDFAKLQQLENQSTPLTKRQQIQYNRLRSRADEISDQALTPEELSTFNKLNAQAGPKMTNSQRQTLDQYAKRAKTGMTSPQRKQYKIDNQSIGSETQRLREQRNQVVDMAQSMTHQNQARNERQAASEATKAQIKQAMDAYQTFQRNPNQQAATALSDTLNRTRDSLQSVHASKETMDTFNSTANTVASELENYNYASRGNVDSNGDGVMDGTQGVYDRVRRNVGKDTDALNKSLSQLSSGGAQQVRNSQSAQSRMATPRSSNNGSVGQAQRMTNVQPSQPRTTTPRNSNNGSVGQAQRMTNSQPSQPRTTTPRNSNNGSVGQAQRMTNSQPAQPRTTTPRSSNNGSVGQAQRMTNVQPSQPQTTTPRSSNNGSVGQTQQMTNSQRFGGNAQPTQPRMSNPTSQNNVGNNTSKPLSHKSTRVNEVHPPRSNQPRR